MHHKHEIEKSLDAYGSQLSQRHWQLSLKLQKEVLRRLVWVQDSPVWYGDLNGHSVAFLSHTLCCLASLT